MDNCDVKFTPLQPKHFALLADWMNQEHVWPWWGEGKNWSLADIEKKYTTYCEGFKVLGAIKKPIHPFIIFSSTQPIGFIQYYNAYDFPKEQGYTLEGLPSSLAALDFYIGNPAFLGKGLGVRILIRFLKTYIEPHYSACFVDPESNNTHAIRTYEKAGFDRVKENDKGILEMIKVF